jgi:membrane protein DedA with SNARE-associated domain
MARVGLGLKLALLYGLALHLHFHIHRHGPAIDYVGLAAACAASFIGLPGPGEPVLIAAAVFAAKHKLDLGSVVVVAWAGALGGGITGWLIGLKAGRALLTRRGPLHALRLKALERGDQLFARYTALAIFLTPAFMAGIHRVGVVKYNVINAAIATVWAVGIGVSAYYVGPPVLDAVDDLGTVASIVLAVVIALVVVGEVLRRWRKSRQARASVARD